MDSVRKLLPCWRCGKIAVDHDEQGNPVCIDSLRDYYIKIYAEIYRSRELGDLYELVELAKECSNSPCDH